MVEETDTLLRRADAAIQEVKRLSELNRCWQDRLIWSLQHMFEKRHTCQLLRVQADEI
jgi:hypothetical protein